MSEKNNRYFHYYNANPRGLDRQDCIYRALSLFLGKTWEEIALEDEKIYLKTGTHLAGTLEIDPNDIHNNVTGAEEFLKKHGCKELILNDKPPTFTVRDFINKKAQKNREYLVIVPSHVTVVKDGKVWDTWDCSLEFPKKIYYFARKKSGLPRLN